MTVDADCQIQLYHDGGGIREILDARPHVYNRLTSRRHNGFLLSLPLLQADKSHPPHGPQRSKYGQAWQGTVGVVLESDTPLPG
jgi:hypothetical protein